MRTLLFVVVLGAWFGPRYALAFALDETPLLDGARLVYQSQQDLSDYRLVKSAIKKVNNQWRADEERLYGLLERKTYVLADTLGYNEALVLLQSAVQAEPSARSIYTCEGLDCGSSNGWANQYLNIKQLYGLDVYQYYTAQQIALPNLRDQVQVFYLVQRGNKRIYLQQDVITLKAARVPSMSVSEIEARLNQDKAVTVLVLPVDGVLEAAQIDEMTRLATLLGKHPLWRLRLVGHDYQAATFELRRKRSLQNALAVREQIIELGANPERVVAYGVASLTPTSGASDRVELVLDKAAIR